MKTTLVYLAGVVTPFALLLLFNAVCTFFDWKAQRRYERAWVKFGAEFDELPVYRLDELQGFWRSESERFGHYSSDRDRYFAMKWRHGQTTEI